MQPIITLNADVNSTHADSLYSKIPRRKHVVVRNTQRKILTESLQLIKPYFNIDVPKNIPADLFEQQ